MTSFAFIIEPAAQPRLAAGVLLLHGAMAALPWLTRCPTPLAIALSLLAGAGFIRCLARVPGSHCGLQAVAAGPGGWRVRMAGDTAWRSATLARESRAAAGGVLLELGTGGRRVGWLLPRPALPPPEFRRLKARIRLAC